MWQQAGYNGSIGLNQRKDALGVFRILENRINNRDYYIYDYYYRWIIGKWSFKERYFYWKNVWEKIDTGKYQRGASPMLFFRAA